MYSLNHLYNLFYKTCIDAYLSDSAAYYRACSSDNMGEFLSTVEMPPYILSGIVFYTDLLADTAFTPTDDDTCSACHGGVAVMASNIVEIYNISNRIARIDPTFDTLEPIEIKSSGLNGCWHYCRYLTGGRNPMYRNCLVMCYADKGVVSLLKYEEILLESLLEQ